MKYCQCLLAHARFHMTMQANHQGLYMIKTITLLKRRPGLSVSEFRAYYESRHVLLGLKYTQPEALRYTRRYLSTLGDDQGGDPCFDVAMELWFADRPTLDRVMQRLQRPDIAAEIAADEEALFDRAQTRFMVVDEEIESIDSAGMNGRD